MKIISLLFSILFLYACKNKSNDFTNKFGFPKNEDRKKLHLIIVDENFDFIQDSIYKESFVSKQADWWTVKVPSYIRKAITLDSSKQNIKFEDDVFFNPMGRKKLTISHNYEDNLSAILFSDPDSSQVIIKPEQADSILKSWRIIQNPFN